MYCIDGWQENQEYSLHTFNEHAPLVSIRDIKMADAVEIETTKPVSSKPSSSVDLTTTESDKANLTTTSHTDTARPKRNISSRTVDMMVEGLGIIKVSKDSIEDEAYYHPNNTNTSTTLLDKRAARQREQAAVLYISHSGRQVAGRDFEHQDICNECWDGGDLIVCDMCPMAFHLDCIGEYCAFINMFCIVYSSCTYVVVYWCLGKYDLAFQYILPFLCDSIILMLFFHAGLKCMPKANIWFCPHHSCATCERRVGAAALLFRCVCVFSAKFFILF